MAYRRSYGSKRRSRRPRRGRRSGYTTMGSALYLAKKAAKGVYYLKGLVNSEKLKHTVPISGSIANPTVIAPNSFHLTAIPIGDDDDQRTGNSILIRSIDLKMTVAFIPAPTVDFGFVRIMVVKDTQQQSDAIPAVADILSSVSMTSHLNADTVGRYTICKDTVYNMNVTTRPNIMFNFTKLMRQHTRYNGTSGSDIQKNGFYLYMWHSAGLGTDNLVYNGEYRVSYHDN